MGDILADSEGAEDAVVPEGEAVSEAIGRAAVGGRISCRAAFRISAEKGVATAEVGRLIDEMGIKISSCQLGCFK